jgi:hypothetical protein
MVSQILMVQTQISFIMFLEVGWVEKAMIDWIFLHNFS